MSKSQDLEISRLTKGKMVIDEVTRDLFTLNFYFNVCVTENNSGEGQITLFFFFKKLWHAFI